MSIDTCRIKQLIHQHLGSVRTLDDVARLSGHHPETLRKTFARLEGEAVCSYICKARLERVKDDLANTDKLCKQILYECGFRREDSGARWFFQATGMTMKAYRDRSAIGPSRE